MGLRGLADKVIVVTGAASGIGYATASRLRAEGSHIALVDIDERQLDKALAALGSPRTIAIVADVGQAEDVDRYLRQAYARFGRIDGLFNNAGITAPRVPLGDLDAAWAERLWRVNFLSTFLGIQGLLRIAAEHPDAPPPAIVNTASGLALGAAPNTAIYAATKAAIVSLTKSVAAETAPRGIRVNAILPGPTETPALVAAPAERRAQFLEAVPMGRFGRPNEIADVAAWLLSEESSFVTGGVYAVDGGQSA